jgi:hypothetical protein
MGRKVFVSYKYSDTQVQGLDVYEDSLLGRVKVSTKARHYVDLLTEILDDGDNIYKGEDDGQSLKEFSDDHIASKLRDKIYDSSITIVLISKGMKSVILDESDQWMPWEISYSLRESTRDERTKRCNGILGVVLPDQWGSYQYYITYNTVCGCRSLNTPFLFDILRQNMFNQKNPVTEQCIDGSLVYSGSHSYIQSVRWQDFKSDPSTYLDKAIENRDRFDEYDITKNLS